MKLKTVELFAGVGGFRVGLNRVSKDFDFVWANQWEPSTKRQYAWECYEKQFGKGSCANENISTVNTKDIPDFDFLVGGFPCQDYSVAKSLKYSGGIEGKKGVLWWDIVRIVEAKKPRFILLENVDRLLISPAKQRGRDFAIILNGLNSMGYTVEWRVINAGAFGMPQKRKRVFIFATKNEEFKSILKDVFPFDKQSHNDFMIDKDILTISDNWGKEIDAKKAFLSHGICKNFQVSTTKGKDVFYGKQITLGDILQPLSEVDKSFFVSAKELEDWKPFKLGRKLERKTKEGHSYIYSEGKMAFPDHLDKPSRTIITAEGGKTPSRFKHLVCQDGQYRRLTPVELERLQMFPDNHTDGFTDIKRAFFMGNALVTGIVTEIGKAIQNKYQ